MRFHKGKDGWGRGSYKIPQFAIAGSSDCGTYSDSPAPSDKVAIELENFRKVLRLNRIHSRVLFTQSGNVFMIKRWVVVSGKDYQVALDLATAYLQEHQSDTHYIHDVSA